MYAVPHDPKRAFLFLAMTLIVFLSCTVGSAAAQSANGNFTIQNVDIKSPISGVNPETDGINEGGEIYVTFDINNTGSSAGRKEVILENNEGEELNRTRLPRDPNRVLDPRDSPVSFNITLEDPPERPTREIFPTIVTPDDKESTEIDVRWNQFVITDFTAEYLEQTGGDNVGLNYTIQNIGTERNKTNIVIENNEDIEVINRSISPSISPNRRPPQYIRQDLKPTEDDSFSSTIEQTPGEYTYELSTENYRTGDDGDTQTATVTIPNTGAVSIDRSYYDTGDNKIRVEATIENQADFDVDQNVYFLVDNSQEDKKSISLNEKESEKVEFSYSTSSPLREQITIKTDAPDTESTEVTAADLPPNNPHINKITPRSLTGGETISVNYTASGSVVDTVTLSVIDPDGQVISESDVPSGEDISATLDIPADPSLINGQYDVRLDAEDTVDRTSTVIKEDAVSVASEVNPDAVGAIGEQAYRAPAGGFVEISTDGKYMLIGGDTNGDGRLTQYFDILYVEEGSTIINTRLIGTNRSSEQAYGEGVTSYAHKLGADAEPDGVFQDVSFQGASTLAEFRENVGIGPRSTPLQTGRYRLLAGANGQVIVEDGAPTFASPVGRSNLVLTQPQLEAVNTYVLPPAPANEEDVAGPSEDATESNTIAAGERLLIELQATGIYGAMIDDPTVDSVAADNVSDLLKNEPGVEMDLSTWYYDGAENTEADLRFEGVSSGDLYVLPDKTTDQWADESSIGENTEIGGLYVVVDTRGEAFSAPSYGDVMQFETRYESPAGERFLYQDIKQNKQPHPFTSAVPPTDGVGHFPYFGDSDTTVTVNSTIEYMEPSIQYGRTTVDGELIVPSESDGQILGSTTMAPGTEATIQFIDQSRSDPELVTIEEVTIEEDRTFTASADFSALDSGDRVTVEFYTAGRLPDNRVVDRRGARVVDDVDNIANYQITNLTTPVAVQQRSSLDAIEATINNTGELTGQQVVRFSIDGEPIRNESLRLSGNSNASISLSEQFVTLPVGAYEYTVQTDNDEQTGELRVTEPDSGTTITNEENSTPTASSPLDESDAPDENDESDAPDENDESTDPSGIFALVGVSGRDVALGAALTGTAHVLGYWT
jgi:hypothetical protein